MISIAETSVYEITRNHHNVIIQVRLFLGKRERLIDSAARTRFMELVRLAH